MAKATTTAQKPAPLPFVKTKDFLSDYDRAKQGGKHTSALKELWALLEILRNSQTIPAKYFDHALKGDWAGWRDCHVAGDFVLIWRYVAIKSVNHVELTACGTHAYLELT